MSNVFVFRRPPHGVITEYFGGGKGGSTTTTNNVTQIPPEVLARYNAVNARAETVAQSPYQAYSNDPNAFVAPLTATQQAGIQNTNAMAGAAQPYYQSATNQLMQAQQGAQPYLGAATAGTLAGAQGVGPSQLNVGQYMNPFTQSVVNATQAAMNQQQGQQLAQQQAEAIRGGAFGGERAGLQRAQLMGQQGLAQAQAIAPLYQQNYNQALAAAQQQQGVGLGAEQANRVAVQQMSQQLANLGQQGYGMGANTSTLLGSIGTNAQQAGLAGAQAQLAAGQAQQQTQQAGLQALYNQFQQQQGFPYQQAQFLANIAEGTGALSGNATSGTSTTTGGGGFFSDERLKENIQRVGETDDGQPIYRYNYKGDKNTQIGLLAQDVEKHHPEAVGLAGGYKTVNYKKATEDAVHKDGGGEVAGLAGGNPAVSDTYRIDAPSAMLQKSPLSMLQENSGKGLRTIPSLPQAFQGGRDIPIEAGANAAGLAAMRAPLVTGTTEPARAGAREELNSLLSAQNQPPGPNGDILGSGPEYRQSRINTLQDWLNKNASPGPQYASAGGLVGPEGGAFAQGGSFARGGLAAGRHGFYGDGYVNPWFEANKGAAQQGVFQLQPNQQRQILQGQQMQVPQRPQQPDAITSALNIEKLVRAGNEMRPDFLRSAADVAARQRTADALAAKEQQYIDWAKEKGYPLPSDAKAADKTGGDGYGKPEEGDDFARGGYAGKGYVNPYGNFGGNDILGPIIEQQDTSLRIPGPGDKGTPAPSSKPQQSGGLGDVLGAGMKARSLYKGGEWAAGKLGLGEASPTAMSATSTEALPSVAGGVVPEAVAPVIPEAVTAAAPEALTAGLVGAETVAAPVAMAAAEGVADLAPLLFFLKNGGAVPRRHHFATDANVPVVVDGEDVGGTETATTGGDDQTTTIRRTAPDVKPVRPVTLGEAVEPVRAAAPKPGLEPSKPSKSFLPEITSEGVRDTLSSENFWVPAIAGLGAMLASPNKTLAGAIGSGLVGGTGAYTGLQKQQSEIAKNSLDIFNKVFEKRVDDEGNISYMNLQTGKPASPQEAFGFLRTMPGFSNLAGAPASGKEKPRDATIELAKNVVQGGTEEQAPRPITPPTSAVAAAAPPAAVETAKPVAPPAATATTVTAAEGEPSIARVPDAAKAEIFRIDQELRAHPEVAAELNAAKKQEAIAARAQEALRKPQSPEMRPIISAQFQEANKQAQDARSRAEAMITRFSAPLYADLAKRLDLTPQMIAAVAARKEAETMAGLSPQVTAAQARAAEEKALAEGTAKAQTELVEVMRPDGSTAYVPKAKVLAGEKPVSPGAGTPPGEVTNNTTPDNVKSLPAASLKMREDIGKDELKMSDDYQKRQIAQSRVHGLLDVLTQYETGKFADTKGDIIGKLRGVGINVPDTASASPAKFEIFMKGAIKNVFDDLPGGKILLAEISGLSKANANFTMQPEANAKILGDALAAVKYEDKYVLDYAKWRQENPNAYSPMDTIRFNEQWLKNNNLDAYKKETARHIGYVGQNLPAKLDDAVHGQRYYIPQTKELRYFDKTFVNPNGSKGGWAKTDPLAGSAAQ
jgi:hypothetical protein